MQSIMKTTLSCVIVKRNKLFDGPPHGQNIRPNPPRLALGLFGLYYDNKCKGWDLRGQLKRPQPTYEVQV